MIEKIFKKIIMLRFPLLLASCALFLYLGYQMHFIESEASASIDDILPEDDGQGLAYEEMKKMFSLDADGAALYLVVKTDSIYSSGTLSFLAAVSEKIEVMEGVKSISDIFTAYSIRGGDDGDLIIEPFMRRGDTDYSAAEITDLSKKIQSDPFAARRLVNEEGRACVITVNFAEGLDEVKRRSVMNAIANLLYREKSERSLQGEFSMIGDAAVQRAIADVQAGEGFIFPLMVCTLCVILFLLFRSFMGVVVPLTIMMLSVTTTIGIKALAASKMSTIDPMLYALITTISISDSIHIISAWYNTSLADGLSRKDRIAAVLAHSLYPCFLTSATTAIGFAAIAITRIPQTRSFGIIASVGVIVAYLWTFILAGPLISVLQPLSKPLSFPFLNGISEGLRRSGQTLSDRLSLFIAVNAKKVLVVAALVALVCGIAVLSVKTGTNPYSFLKDSHPINRALHFVETEFSGISSVDIVFKTDEAGYFKSATALSVLDSAVAEMETIEGVTRSDSLLLLIKQMNAAMHGKKQGHYALPDSDRLIAQYLLLYEMSGDGDVLARWMSDDYAKVRVRLMVGNDTDIVSLKRRLQTIVSEMKFSQPVEMIVTGDALLWQRIDSHFINGQMTSLLVSLTVILGSLFFVFSSLRLGIYSALVNLFPILFGLGLMGLSGIQLSMGTVMIASIAIGIAVDDTIHFLFRFRELDGSNEAFAEKLQKTNRMTLRPVISTSLILAVGFFSNMSSSFKPNSYFGLISGIVIISACVADVFILPSLIAVFGYSAKGKKQGIGMSLF